jgi:hypothetical protein
MWIAQKRYERDRRRYEKLANRPSAPTTTIKEAVFNVMPASVAHATGNGALPVYSRQLQYAVRKRIQTYTEEELTNSWWNALLTQYQQQHGRIPGLYYDPRGTFREPHRGKVVPLGTREVEKYVLPEYVFGSILFIEKEGFYPLLDASRLAERFDLAIASGKGQPTEAVRALFQRAEAGEYRLFVVHDADPWGYSIARTISEETDRMPDYSVEVVDLGLSVADAIEHDLDPEDDTRKKRLPRWMPERLSDIEWEWFEGERYEVRAATRDKPAKYHWACKRVELNAFSAPEFIAFLEDKLRQHDVGKLMPSVDIPDDVVTDQVTDSHREAIGEFFDRTVASLFDRDGIIDTMMSETERSIRRGNPARWVTDAYKQNQSIWWRRAILAEIERRVGRSEQKLQTRLIDLLREAL